MNINNKAVLNHESRKIKRQHRISEINKMVHWGPIIIQIVIIKLLKFDELNLACFLFINMYLND